jgi:hypothetical protein
LKRHLKVAYLLIVLSRPINALGSPLQSGMVQSSKSLVLRGREVVLHCAGACE